MWPHCVSLPLAKSLSDFTDQYCEPFIEHLVGVRYCSDQLTHSNQNRLPLCGVYILVDGDLLERKR